MLETCNTEAHKHADVLVMCHRFDTGYDNDCTSRSRRSLRDSQMLATQIEHSDIASAVMTTKRNSAYTNTDAMHSSIHTVRLQMFAWRHAARGMWTPQPDDGDCCVVSSQIKHKLHNTWQTNIRARRRRATPTQEHDGILQRHPG